MPRFVVTKTADSADDVGIGSWAEKGDFADDGIILQGDITTARPVDTLVRNSLDGELYVSTDAITPTYTQLTNSGGGGGGTGIVAGGIWVVDSSVASSTYPNGLRYVPLVASQSVDFQFAVGGTGTLDLQIVYAMSGASANSITLRVDTLVLGEDADPSAGLTTGTPFNVTPGNDVNIHWVTSADSTDLQLSVTDGDLVRVVITRTDATHPGDLRILELRED